MTDNEPARGEPIIRCEDLAVAYGRDVVLHGVSLAVHPGEFLPIVGPNGAGKTTLLRTILGLISPSSGRVVTPFDRRPAGYVPQHKAIDPLYPVSARQIVAMGLYPRLGWWRRPSAADREAVDAALEELGLADHAGKIFSELSGGMKQKTLIARALASGADVFVMDEPTSELDHDSEKEVVQHLFELCSRQGKTALIAQHGVDLVSRLAEKLCLVDHGHARFVSAEEYADHQNHDRSDAP